VNSLDKENVPCRSKNLSTSVVPAHKLPNNYTEKTLHTHRPASQSSAGPNAIHVQDAAGAGGIPFNALFSHESCQKIDAQHVCAQHVCAGIYVPYEEEDTCVCAGIYVCKREWRMERSHNDCS